MLYAIHKLELLHDIKKLRFIHLLDVYAALPDGWYRFGSKLLKLVLGGKTWNGAALSCQSIGGELVSINNEDENEFIFHLLDQVQANIAS